MAYFRVLTSQLAHIQSLLCKSDKWLILVNADPDALGSAMALQRIIRKKVKKVDLVRINDISRPDNLAMIRNLRIPVKAFDPEILESYQKFAIVDSQPHHSPLFSDIEFSIVIDHHPLPLPKEDSKDSVKPSKISVLDKNSEKNSKEQSCPLLASYEKKAKSTKAPSANKSKALLSSAKNVEATSTKVPSCSTLNGGHCSLVDKSCIHRNLENIKEKPSCPHFNPHKVNCKDSAKPQAGKSNKEELLNPQKMQDIRPDYGATCTMLTEYLYNAHIRPGKHLATALQYGIRTDTGTFGKQSTELDLRAYHYLSRFADQTLLTRIMRSEYLPQWLPYFSRAFDSFRPCGLGHFTYLSNVDSPDILVVIADFFLKVHGLKYVVIAGVYDKQVICIFRGTDVNLGILAQKAFSDYGSAGGHKTMARAEIPLSKIRSKHEDLSFNLRKKELSEEENQQLESFLLARLKQFGTKKALSN